MADIIAFPEPELDSEMITALSADSWASVGMSCRLAYLVTTMNPSQYRKIVEQLLDDDPQELWALAEMREQHRKMLLRCLLLMRKADKRLNAALDVAMTARGF